MRVDGLHHLAIKAQDVVRTADFYRIVLGLPERQRAHDAAGLRAVWLDVGPAILMIERADTDGPAPADRPFEADAPGLHLLALTIAPASHAEWRKRLADHEVEVAAASDFTLYVRDPEGNRVGLSSYPAPGAP